MFLSSLCPCPHPFFLDSSPVPRPPSPVPRPCSTDGPDHNVLKIKPPLPFAARDARRLIAALDCVLAEDAFRVASRAGQ